jgi:hypothetical protein
MFKHVSPRLLRAAVFAAAIVLVLSGVALAVPSKSGELLKDEAHRLEQLKASFSGGNKGGSAWNIEVVGHNDLGGRGFNADVWTHGGFAYVGHWGFTDWATGNERFCPSSPKNGIAVLDATDPTQPAMVSRLENPPGTSAEDVVVYTAESGPLTGHDVAAVGIQVCGGSRYDLSFQRGLQLWDVTEPSHPLELGFWDAECCTRGVHEFEVEYRADLGRTFAYATVPTSRYPDDATASGYRDDDGDGDFRLIDITDPTDPVQVSDWGIQDIGGPFSDGQGCDPDANYGHGAEPSADGRLAFLSYWDSGFIELDVSDPGSPVFKGRTVYPADADGDAHSSQWDEDRQLLFGADEDFCKASGSGIEKGFGYMRIYDYSDPAAPRQIGAYRTPNSLGTDDQAAGDFVIHNNFLVGTDVYSSWYSDGVRVVDASDPTHPVEVAYFVPPAGDNPVKPSQRAVLSNTTQIWGVVVDEATGLIYASDMNTGLWILRRTGG